MCVLDTFFCVSVLVEMTQDVSTGVPTLHQMSPQQSAEKSELQENSSVFELQLLSAV